jgi:hypothetical protein
MLALTAMIRRGSASMRSMIVLSWNSSRLLARLKASISFGRIGRSNGSNALFVALWPQ